MIHGMEERRSILDSKAGLIFLEILFILCIIFAALGDSKQIALTSMKAISLISVAIGFVVLFISGDFRRLKKVAAFFGIYGFILLAIIVWSVFLWIMNMESIDFILRGVLKFMYQFFVLLIISSACYMFGERAINVIFYGLAAANLIIIIMEIPNYGIAGCIESISYFISSGGDQKDFMRAIEIHDLTFTFGFFLIYFVFFAKRNKERIVSIVLSVLLFILGWKRIAVAALLAVLIFGILFGIIKGKTRVILINMVCWGAVLFAFAYVVVVRYDIFTKVMELFEIDTMGRDAVYDYIQKYYNISIAFLGYGFEYTTVLLQEIAEHSPEIRLGVLALHNNILTVYIELGFFGFFAWLFYTWPFQYRWLINKQGEKTALLFIMCELYIFITYMTDNTLYYYWTSLVLRLLPMAYSLHNPEHTDQFYWPWIKVKKI